MASKLRHTSARVSFFSFQDIITTVTGVLIIVMLILSLESTNRAVSATDPARAALQRELQQARQQLAANLEALRQRQADASALANRVFVLPQPDASGKQPVLVALSATNCLVIHFGQTNVTEFPLGRGAAGFEQVLAACNKSRDRLVFYVRPSGIAQFQICQKSAADRGFDKGSDAADENSQYLFTR